MINKIKKDIENNIGKFVRIVTYGSRSKSYIYEGKIENAYKNIFTIVVEKELYQEIKSFSYVDILTEKIKINIK